MIDDCSQLEKREQRLFTIKRNKDKAEAQNPYGKSDGTWTSRHPNG